MQKYLLILLTSTILFSFSKDTTIMDVKEKIVTINDIPVYNFESLEPLLYTDSNKIHIVNFWAMWCAPCIKELPILKEFEINNPNVEITLVSLDFPEDIETRLKPFLERKGITSKVVLLDDPDQNSWINKIDPNWSGAIPFTIIFNNENRTFHERAFNDIKDLENEVYNTINK
ncbi:MULTISPECIES: TlpA family protein disulfide reductase [unclassified Maribacter]|uniref:TlpA family protein disulfide reductase n=1 Tax=unclassified Maribacter TaxID=2615042 RepID=UPI00257EC749|nr:MULTISPECIES: TlpA disulfide reductase family protein [unclassified Maribacter]